ncbi:winged helix-turn-helix domain-containing protein [Oribacterium sp. WCC10]|uniref:winged helix-turn-helix domain-containing protein n=1 Tax=Oribacterium sp. WCC10 TaxID=1855343 RepID=UPI0008F410A8|nr:winged helix-turn-helix domain-containing protein [Oribacterium sp. WCC10]SFG45275.1 Transcriptional regulatory protein, C terminal [Oribacterium sp. WCC10]
MLRRNMIEQADAETGQLKAGDIILNQQTTVLKNMENQQEVRLSEKELHILELFMMNPDRILTREQLAVKIWGYENEAEYNNVEVYISFTRKKLQFIRSHMEIKAVRGLGYQLRNRLET